MNIRSSKFIRSYGFSILLIVSIGIGSLLGIVLKKEAVLFKPFGDVFLNLLFTAIIPLVFFSISSAVAGMSNIRRLGKILSAMLFVFMVTGMIASTIMAFAVQFYPPAAGIRLDVPVPASMEQIKTTEQIVKAFAAPDFPDILSKKNTLALIIFSILIGLATSAVGEKGKAFSAFLTSGSEVMMKVISYVMFYAPVGLCAYFAYFIGVYGPELLGSYVRAMEIYYPITILYFFLAFTLYAYLAARGTGVQTFWKNIIPPSLTALATGSSVATIPSNLEAANKTGIPKDISEVVIPLGATIHMEGSCLAAILKIAFLFGLYHLDFSGTQTFLTAIGIAILCGTVVSGIPGGGTIGELLIISLYGFPPESFPIITMIGTLVDPPATMVNAIGDNVTSMMIARMLGGKDWMRRVSGERNF
ncbi:MAG: dicarboxylate/amino acid:cation symporter [Deltaproteobacteria bacterium]|nr:dicarboxylate/amino acid:cation symporter [Deltaproteobacteria bacterium]